MKGMPGGLQQFMRQANQLQAKMAKLQDDLNQREYESTSGGGAVSVRVSGENQILSLTISEDVMKSGDTEMLQDLVITAVNDALKTAKKTGQDEMGKLTGGAGIPGMF